MKRYDSASEKAVRVSLLSLVIRWVFDVVLRAAPDLPVSYSSHEIMPPEGRCLVQALLQVSWGDGRFTLAPGSQNSTHFGHRVTMPLNLTAQGKCLSQFGYLTDITRGPTDRMVEGRIEDKGDVAFCLLIDGHPESRWYNSILEWCVKIAYIDWLVFSLPFCFQCLPQILNMVSAQNNMVSMWLYHPVEVLNWAAFLFSRNGHAFCDAFWDLSPFTTPSCNRILPS